MRRRAILEEIIEQMGYDPTELIRPNAKPQTAYKLFRTKADDDQLYPLFVDSQNGLTPGGSRFQEAIAGDIANDKGQVKSSIGPLAYRPGWHAGDLPMATHIGGKSKKGLKAPDYRPDNQVWAEISMPNKVDWQRIANDRVEYTKAGKPMARTAHITDQIPYQGHYRYKTNPNMTGEWLIGGDMRVNRVLEDAEVEDINARAGLADLPRLGKLGLAGLVGAGALTESEEADALPKGKAARALMEEYGMDAQKIADAETMGFDTNEVFWRGGSYLDEGNELPMGRAGGVYFSPQKEYAEQYGEVSPYLLRHGNQLDMSRNPEHEKMVVDAFNEKGGWQQAQFENYAFDEQELANRASKDPVEVGPGNPYPYNPELDDQWEVLDEPETDVLYDFVPEHFNTTRHLERRKEGHEGLLFPDDQRNAFRRLDADFDPKKVDSKNILASLGAGTGVGALAFNPQESYAAELLNTGLADAALAEEHGTATAPGSPIAHGASMIAGDLERSVFPDGLPFIPDMFMNHPGVAKDLLQGYAYDGVTNDLALEGAFSILPWLRTGSKLMRRGASAVFPRLYEDEDE